ncbi:tetratricopeptide repeat protein [bacterium]|nr:tetratricopeptide repeat protein [bacterium]
MRIPIYTVLACMLFYPGNGSADPASTANKRGIEAYNRKDYEKSLGYFNDALVERPDTPKLNFNRGTALSALNKPEEAVNEFLSAARKLGNSGETAAAYFNAGNTLMAANNFEGAIGEYKNAVKLDPSSPDIRHNLELAVRKLNQQKEEQKKDKQQQNNEKQQNEDKNKQKEQDKKEQEKQQDKSKEQQNKSQSPQDGEKKDQQQQPSQQQDNQVMPMTPEEAKRLLDAINNDEKRALSQRYTQMKTGIRQGDDW